MGQASADGYAEAVREGYASLRQAIAANLTSNHFPPLPVAYVDPIIEAIEADDGPSRYSILVRLPDGIDPRPRHANYNPYKGGWWIDAGTLLDITHSWGFVNDEED